ncbi:MAG: hypothetical protein ACK55Z_30015 [bacterium]
MGRCLDIQAGVRDRDRIRINPINRHSDVQEAVIHTTYSDKDKGR